MPEYIFIDNIVLKTPLVHVPETTEIVIIIFSEPLDIFDQYILEVF